MRTNLSNEVIEAKVLTGELFHYFDNSSHRLSSVSLKRGLEWKERVESKDRDGRGC